MHTSKQQQRIVILGGGFAGVYAALRAEKTLARDPDVDVTLVSRENFLLFTPMLHEVATSDLDPAHIVNPIRKLLRRVNFFLGEVESIDLPARTVTVSHGDAHHHHDLPYDHLVLALGAVTNYCNLPGLEERALTMKSLGDAIRLRNRVIKNLEEADFECCADRRASLLTVVAAGAGFAGVETLGGLNDFVRNALRFYPHLKEEMIRFVLVDAGPAVLPELTPKLGAYAEKKLVRRKIEVLLNTKVEAVSDRGVRLSNGATIPTNTLIWTGGNAPHPLLSTLPCRKERGRPVVNEFLELPEWPGVWALGDCAAARDPRSGLLYPPTAQHALRQGKVLGRNLEAAVRGGTKKPFVFSMLGQLAAIGRRSGVANILGLNFSGFLAWFLWRTIYLSKLPRLEKKVRVALDWTLDLFFSKDLVQLTTERPPAVAHLEADLVPGNSPAAPEWACGTSPGVTSRSRAPESPVPSSPAESSPMQDLMNRICSTLFGDSRHYSLEQRLFNTLSLLNGVTNLGGALSMLLFANQGFVLLLHLGTGALFLAFYYFARSRKAFHLLYWPFVLLTLAFVFVNALGNAGTSGGAHYYLIPALLIAIILSDRMRTTVLALALFVVATGALLLVEQTRPEWVRLYANPGERLVDVSGNLLFVQVFSGIIVMVLAQNLNQERSKSDRLLRNVLPESIAQELKENDRVMPLEYESASVLFTDFVGFTRIAERLAPQELIEELDCCFRLFDQVVKKHKLEKIKTIGDSYMAVGGIPVANQTHAVDCVLAALEIQYLMGERMARNSAAQRPHWQLRIGINSGNVVAGVIGHEKFAYDVWGDWNRFCDSEPTEAS